MGSAELNPEVGDVVLGAQVCLDTANSLVTGPANQILVHLAIDQRRVWRLALVECSRTPPSDHALLLHHVTLALVELKVLGSTRVVVHFITTGVHFAEVILVSCDVGWSLDKSLFAP